MSKEEWIEKYGPGLLEAYYKLCVINYKEDDLWQARMDYESALVRLGLLEEDVEEDPEEENEADHYDEWMLDHKIDCARDEEYVNGITY